MAGKQLLENVGCSAVGFAVGTCISKIRRHLSGEDAIVDATMEKIRSELRSATSTLESAAPELTEMGGNLCSIISVASIGLLVCTDLILAFHFKGEGGDGGRGPHGGDGDHID